MAFGQELKDFTAGFEKGWDLIEKSQDSKSKREYTAALKKYYESLTNKETGVPEANQISSAGGALGRQNANLDATGGMGQTADLVPRVLAAEAGGGSDEELAAAAHSVVNRAKFTGKRPEDVVRVPYAYEAFTNGKYKSQPDAEVQRAAAIYKRVQSGELPDPLASQGGTTHFLAPAVMDSEGRNYPAWSQAGGTMIGRQKFFARPQDFAPRRSRIENASYAGGGLVSAIPAYSEGGIAGYGMENEPSPQAAQPVVDPAQFVDPVKSATAWTAGENAWLNLIGFKKGAAMQSNETLTKMANSEGAADTKDVEDAKNAVDPRKQLTEDNRNMAALNAGWDYYMKQGKKKEADAYAAQMYAYAKKVVHQKGLEAEQRARAGDIKGAAEATQQAHNIIPNGDKMQIDGVSPQGVSYSIYDSDGNLTEQAQASVDQLLYIATGMRNGTEFFKQSQIIKDGLTSRERQMQKFQKAHTEFEALQPTGGEGYRKTLTPEQQAAYDKLHPSERKQLESTYGKDKAAQDQQELAGVLDRVTSARDRLAQAKQGDNLREEQDAQKAFDEATGMATKWAAGDQGRLKLLSTNRQLFAQAGAIPTTGEAYPKGATKEQKAAIDAENQYRGNVRNVLRGTGPLAAEGPTSPEQQAAAIAGARGDYAFNQNAGEAPDEAGLNAIDQRFDKDWKGMPESNKYVYRGVASNIAKGNNIQPDQAAFLTSAAVKSKDPPQRLPDGRLMIGDTPVYLDNASVTMLAKLRTGGESAKQTAGISEPGWRSPVAMEQQAPAKPFQAEKQAIQARRSEQAERSSLRQKLGTYYEAAGGDAAPLDKLRRTFIDLQSREASTTRRPAALGYR